MRLVVVRSGGIAGMRRTWSSEVSSQEAEERWLPLLQDAPSAEAHAGMPDRFTYEISVGKAAVTIPEESLQGRWRELVDRARKGNGEARAPE
ncbi:protealysin inhibitor emfourin [Arthrobacter pullicola]|uniref:protealysin inhibitor emfourin n=1 Tax=Arthrobacter pullicola TaxID=2762224 RepID=UPI00177CF5C8|nr:protealysin inhibitor emfourin [Arthrobacter pullicola]